MVPGNSCDFAVIMRSKGISRCKYLGGRIEVAGKSLNTMLTVNTDQSHLNMEFVINFCVNLIGESIFNLNK